MFKDDGYQDWSKMLINETGQGWWLMRQVKYAGHGWLIF